MALLFISNGTICYYISITAAAAAVAAVAAAEVSFHNNLVATAVYQHVAVLDSAFETLKQLNHKT
jgi:hypothetical protein